MKGLLRKLSPAAVCSYIGGIFLIAIGVNVSKLAGLGISPVASVPYAVELIWGIELGKATTLVYVFLILLQLILLRKLTILPFFQLVTTVVMSTFTTYTSGKYLLCWLEEPSGYLHSCIYLAVSIVIIGVGVYFYIRPGFVPLPSEGTAKTLAQISGGKLPFHNAKILVDCSLVVISVTMTLVMTGKISAVREGTVVTAILVGKIVGLCRKAEAKLLCGKEGTVSE